MKDMTKSQIKDLLTDPLNPQPFGKLQWNGNELVFGNHPRIGVVGISPNMPDVLGKIIAKRYNATRPEVGFEEDLKNLLEKYLNNNKEITCDYILAEFMLNTYKSFKESVTEGMRVAGIV